MADEPKVPKAAPEQPPSKPRDVVLVHGRTEDRQGYQALRVRPERLELAELRPVQKGKPLGSGELISLRPRQELPGLFDVNVLYEPGEDGAGTGPGPAQVASERYRANWEVIFGDPEPRGLADPGDDPKALN